MRRGALVEKNSHFFLRQGRKVGVQPKLHDQFPNEVGGEKGIFQPKCSRRIKSNTDARTSIQLCRKKVALYCNSSTFEPSEK